MSITELKDDELDAVSGGLKGFGFNPSDTTSQESTSVPSGADLIAQMQEVLRDVVEKTKEIREAESNSARFIQKV